jgi:hypothetical protein
MSHTDEPQIPGEPAGPRREPPRDPDTPVPEEAPGGDRDVEGLPKIDLPQK